MDKPRDIVRIVVEDVDGYPHENGETNKSFNQADASSSSWDEKSNNALLVKPEDQLPAKSKFHNLIPPRNKISWDHRPMLASIQEQDIKVVPSKQVQEKRGPPPTSRQTSRDSILSHFLTEDSRESSRETINSVFSHSRPGKKMSSPAFLAPRSVRGSRETILSFNTRQRIASLAQQTGNKVRSSINFIQKTLEIGPYTSARFREERLMRLKQVRKFVTPHFSSYEVFLSNKLKYVPCTTSFLQVNSK